MLSWSYSTLSQYEQCPHKLVLKRTAVPKDPNETLSRGLKLHKALDNFMKGGDLPPLSYFTEELIALREQQPLSEHWWGVNADWTPCTDRKKAWGQCIVDCAIIQNDPPIISIIDYKTGKLSPIKHQDQGITYAIIAKCHYPTATSITTQFLYLDSGKRAKHQYSLESLDHYKTILNARINRMMSDTTLAPKPNKYVCKYCDYRTQCDYNVAE